VNLVIAGVFLTVFVLIKWIKTGEVLFTGGKVKDNIIWCSICNDWATHFDGKCATCGFETDTGIRIIQAAETHCKMCRRPTLHYIRSATLLTCGTCILPRYYAL
jgi:hypothetical protein